MEPWLGIEGSNLGFLSQSQASYHWTNPQGLPTYCNPGVFAGQDLMANGPTRSGVIIFSDGPLLKTGLCEKIHP